MKMTSINEILNRDLRTTLSLKGRIKDRFSNTSLLSEQKHSEILYNCDCCQTKRVLNFYARSYKNIMSK